MSRYAFHGALDGAYGALARQSPVEGYCLVTDLNEFLQAGRERLHQFRIKPQLLVFLLTPSFGQLIKKELTLFPTSWSRGSTRARTWAMT